MTEQEVLEKYKIPKHVWKEYHEWGLCPDAQRMAEKRQYSDQDIKRIGDIMALHDMGFEPIEIKRYMELSLQGNATTGERVKLLNLQRRKILDEIHFKERQIERMDYLKSKIKKISNDKGEL